jgi:hypothetical protein
MAKANLIGQIFSNAIKSDENERRIKRMLKSENVRTFEGFLTQRSCVAEIKFDLLHRKSFSREFTSLQHVEWICPPHKLS